MRFFQSQEALQKERDSIINKYQETKNRMVAMDTENKSLKSQVSTSEEQIQRLRAEAKDMLLVQDELDAKLKALKQV